MSYQYPDQLESLKKWLAAPDGNDAFLCNFLVAHEEHSDKLDKPENQLLFDHHMRFRKVIASTIVEAVQTKPVNETLVQAVVRGIAEVRKSKWQQRAWGFAMMLQDQTGLPWAEATANTDDGSASQASTTISRSLSGTN